MSHTFEKQYDLRFTFQNVGQGLCFTGKIDSFNFMYDCGSRAKKHLESVLSQVIGTQGFTHLDVLVISHFHDDHTSGIKFLLDQQVIPKSVFIPYVSPVERLALALLATEPEEWYLSFLANPVGYLHDRGVTDVYVMSGNDPDLPDSDYTVLPDGPPDQLPDGKLFFDIHRKKQLNKDNLDQDDMYFDEIHKQNRDFFFLDHKSLFSFSGLWYFKFYNLEMPQADLSRFRDALAAEGIIGTASILKVFNDKALMKRLEGIFKALPIAYNDTSLCLYHGPNALSQSGYVMEHVRQTWHANCPTGGFMLTGDFTIENPANCASFTQHYTRELGKSISYLIPHHGSATGWNDSLLGKLPNLCTWTYSVNSRSVHHPATSVLRELARNGLHFLEVNEMHSLIFRGSFFLPQRIQGG